MAKTAVTIAIGTLMPSVQRQEAYWVSHRRG
jgi:hypothetical protein